MVSFSFAIYIPGITIYKDGAVINEQVSKISLYRSSTDTGMSLTNKPDL